MTPPIHFHITPGDDSPIYRQVVRQVLQGVAAGALGAGERLPSLRELGKELTVAPLTIKKAYDVLEADGVIESRRGKGTFISDAAVPAGDDAVERLRPLARRLVSEAEVAGIDRDALVRVVEEESRRLEEQRGDNQKKREADA